jgi:phosphohistidine phosphatase SixA
LGPFLEAILSGPKLLVHAAKRRLQGVIPVMSRKLVAALCLFAAGAASVLFVAGPDRFRPVWAGGADCQSGDLNHDGSLNVSDAVHLLVHLFKNGPAPQPCGAAGGDGGYFPGRLNAATVVVVRHAERENASEDSPLSEDGKARAQRLAQILAGAPVTHLIASNRRRTQETLAPLAASTGLAVEELALETEVVERLGQLGAESFAVVAHHSFTVHDILEGLGLQDVRQYDVSTRYDHFFLVLRQSAEAAQLVHFTY